MKPNLRILCLLVAISILVPIAMADDVVIINGPNVITNSNNALAWGGKFWATDDANVDNTYWAYYGVHALAIVPQDPNGIGGYAYAKFVDVSDSFNHVQQMNANPNGIAGSKVKTQLSYTGSVEANVDLTPVSAAMLAAVPVANIPGIAYANIGAGAADFNFDAGKSVEATNYMIGGAGQFSALLLPLNGVGNAATSGSALFDQGLLGTPYVDLNGNLVSDEPLEIYGNVDGTTSVKGINSPATGTSFGLAAEGSIAFASRYGEPAAGHEGLSLALSGKTTLASAGQLVLPTATLNIPADEPNDIKATATGATYAGAWDGATVPGTYKMRGVNENVRTVNTGTSESFASTVLPGDFGIGANIMGDIAFHVASPLEMPDVFTTATLADAFAGDEQYATLADAQSQITDAIMDAKDNIKTGSQIDEILNRGGYADDIQNFVDIYTPDITTVDTTVLGQQGLPGPDIVAADFAFTAAVANRNRNVVDPDATNHVTAESFIKPGTVNNPSMLTSTARQGDHVVTDAIVNLDQQSGAHVAKGPKFYGSIGGVMQGAAEDYTSPIPALIGGVYATGNANFLATLGPATDGQRWNDAGSRSKMDLGTSTSGSGNQVYTQSTTGWDGISWIVGDNPNPQLKGGEYTTTFTKPGGKPQAELRSDNLLDVGPIFGYRASLYATTVAGQIGL